MILPSGETAVASMIRSPAPESARWPRWIRCQSVAEPSCAEYWHIGATMMRLARRSAPIWSGSNRWLMARRDCASLRCDRIRRCACARRRRRRAAAGGRRSARPLQPAVGVEVAQRLPRVAELLVQARRVVVRVGEVGRQPQAACRSSPAPRRRAAVFERERAVEVQQRFVRAAAQRLVVERTASSKRSASHSSAPRFRYASA